MFDASTTPILVVKVMNRGYLSPKMSLAKDIHRTRRNVELTSRLVLVNLRQDA